MESTRNSLEAMADAIRRRICLHEGGPFVLHETDLAKEFGVSRTPVRQALQRLQHEGLVEVRSGVGSVVIPLDPAQAERDQIVARALFHTAALAAEDKPVPSRVRYSIIGLASGFDPRSDLAGTFEIRARMLELLATLVKDPILRDAFLASHWRLIRWRMQGDRANGDEEARRTSDALNRITKAMNGGTAADVFRSLEQETPDEQG